MPELPEVEVTRLGISPYIEGNIISKIKVYTSKLRLPVPKGIVKKLSKQRINSISRCSRYLLFNTQKGTLILHLGMTGHLNILSKPAKSDKHDIVDIMFKDQTVLRYNDVRRFGLLIWTETNPLTHKLLKDIGPDPLTEKVKGKYLFQKSRNRKIPIKQFIMNNRIVAGVGNIYANESLFISRIHPLTPAGNLSQTSFNRLVRAIKNVLEKSVKTGIAAMNFEPGKVWTGYFPQKLNVYKREGLCCKTCKNTVEKIVIGQRSTFFCGKCQKPTA